MDKLRQLKVANHPFPPAPTNDITFLGTTEYGPYCSLLMKRTKEDAPVLYNFVWQNSANDWSIVREFTLKMIFLLSWK